MASLAIPRCSAHLVRYLPYPIAQSHVRGLFPDANITTMITLHRLTNGVAHRIGLGRDTGSFSTIGATDLGHYDSIGRGP